MTRARDVANIDGLLTTTGDTFYASAAGTPARLGVGSTGQVLTVAAGVPSWATPAATTLPTFSAYPTGTNQSVAATTFTKILFGTEAWDTAGNFASSTFTPTTAGYYQLNTNVYISGLVGNDNLYFYKNGSSYVVNHTVTAGEQTLNLSTIMYFNGTTDYAEVYIYRNGSGAQPVQSGQLYTQFNGVGIRS